MTIHWLTLSQLSVERFKNRGLSLVELMVSLLLGSMLSLAISVVYIQSLRNFVAENEMARLQDNGRYALLILRRELMLAGFFAGISVGPNMRSTNVSNDCVDVGNWALETVFPLDMIDDFDTAAKGALLSVSGVALNCLQANQIASGTDIISVKRTAGNYTVKDGLYHESSKARAGQWYVRSHRKSGRSSWLYNKSGALPSEDIGAGNSIDYWEYYARIFYIRKYSEVIDDGVPSLCVESLSGGSSLGKMSSQCLVEGVEDLQIEFGVDRDFDGAPDTYVSTPGPLDIANSTVARIFLLMRSVAKVPGQATSRRYVLGAKEVVVNDTYIRRVLSETVRLPNLLMARR